MKITRALTYDLLLLAFKALPIDGSISAGQCPPRELVAVFHPPNLCSPCASEKLDQKFIVNDDIQMTMMVKFSGTVGTSEDDHVHSLQKSASSH